MQKQIIWKSGSSKLKHTTLCNEYEQGGLKNVDIFSKITSLQCSWVKRLYDDSFHAWKVIPLFLIKNYLGNSSFSFLSKNKLSLDAATYVVGFYTSCVITAALKADA